MPSYQHTGRVSVETHSVERTHHVKQDSVGVECVDVGLHDECTEKEVLRNRFEFCLVLTRRVSPWFIYGLGGTFLIAVHIA